MVSLYLRLGRLPTLVVHNQKGQKHNCGSDPVQWTRILLLQNDLADQRQRYSQAQPDSDDQRRGQEHSVCPADIRDEGEDRVNLLAMLIAKIQAEEFDGRHTNIMIPTLVVPGI